MKDAQEHSLFARANILRSLAFSRPPAGSKSPPRSTKTQQFHNLTIGPTSSPSPRVPNPRPLLPLLPTQTTGLRSSSPFTDLIKEDPEAVLRMKSIRLNMKMSQDHGMDNTDLVQHLQMDTESESPSLLQEPRKRHFKESKMCWKYQSSEVDVQNLIRARLYHPIEDGKVSKPEKAPLSTRPRTLINLDPQIKKEKSQEISTPRKKPKGQSQRPISKFLLMSSHFPPKRRGTRYAMPQGVSQQTTTPALTSQHSWEQVTEFLIYTKERYRRLFLQIAGKETNAITKESFNSFLTKRQEKQISSRSKMVDTSEAELVTAEVIDESESSPYTDDPPQTWIRVESRLRAPDSSPVEPLFVQASGTPLHSKDNEEVHTRSRLSASLLVSSTQKLFSDGLSDSVSFDQFIAVLVMYEYTWNGFPLKKGGERAHKCGVDRFDPGDGDLVSKMKAEIRELKKVYKLLTDTQTGTVKNKSLEAFLKRMKQESLNAEEGDLGKRLNPKHFSFHDFCMAIPFIMSDQLEIGKQMYTTMRRRPSMHILVYIILQLCILTLSIVNLSLSNWFSYCWWHFGLISGETFFRYDVIFANESTIADVRSDVCDSDDIKDFVQMYCPAFCSYAPSIEAAGIAMIAFGVIAMVFTLVNLVFHVFLYIRKRNGAQLSIELISMWLILPALSYFLAVLVYVGGSNLGNYDKVRDFEADPSTQPVDVTMGPGLGLGIGVVGVYIFSTVYGLITTRKEF